MQHLQPNSTLQGGKYKIEKVLGQGGFGITYLAEQVMLGRKVAVKEFFMKELCDRDESTSHVTLGTEGSRETVNRFREKFLKEARNIARLNHPNIVRIIDVFEENGTAYYVMEYAENGSLADKVAHEGYLSEPVATRYILQVAEALDYVHQQKMNHLDVKPANIMLNEKDESVLIDFGLSKQYDVTTGNQTSTTPVGISEGYAPMEQYMQGGVEIFSPETDIYSLGATYYNLLTGTTPPNASYVNNEGLPLNELRTKHVSNNAVFVICKAMEGRKRDRLHAVSSFNEILKDTSTTTRNTTSNSSDTTILIQDGYSVNEQKCIATNQSDKKQANYLYGDDGYFDGSFLHVEMSQVKRVSGRGTESVCQFNGIRCERVWAYSKNKCFLAVFDENGRFFALHYYHKNNGTNICGMSYIHSEKLEKKLFGGYKHTGKYVNEFRFFHYDSSGDDTNVGKSSWFQSYGTLFKRDLNESRQEIMDMLGFDPVIEEYWNW